jgi:hypothetical protein
MLRNKGATKLSQHNLLLCVLCASPENRKFRSNQVVQNAIFIARRVFIHGQLCGEVLLL